MKIAIIAAALPPRLDGIGDYTAHLAAELAGSATVTVLAGQEHAAPIPGVEIVPAFLAAQPGSVRALATQVEKDPPDWLLLQYNPFCYGPRGFNPRLSQVWRGIRRRHPEVRLALMVHEPFVPVTNWKFAVMTTWQRWQLWSLGRAADSVFCSIDPWARRFRPWFPGKPVAHLPVGSNVPLTPLARSEARDRLGISEETVVLGVFGTLSWTRLLARIRAAAETVRAGGRDVLVLYMGPDGGLVRQGLDGFPVRADGPLEAGEISRRFAAVDIYLAPFVDGVSTRRTSLMTALQHGVATAGTRGWLTDALLVAEDGRALLLADAKDADAYKACVRRLLEDDALRARLGQQAQRLYQREFAWERIAAQLMRAFSAPVEAEADARCAAGGIEAGTRWDR
ncbi:MAG TPA: glycosyltransferase family 4 protein [Chthonomonadaceae bacterium]|nr:glycosyltransferase family 4 protein [Chthonomonadaceae bacterium]